MKPCSYNFKFECKVWLWFAIATTLGTGLTGLSLLLIGYTSWSLLVECSIVAGTIACVVWWIWAMQKMYHIAHWWNDLHTRLDHAIDLLIDAKQDLSEIKKSVKQENNLFD